MCIRDRLSGYLNAYTYATRGGIFANMHTGNMTKLGIGLASGNVAGSWQYLAPILAAVLGVVFSELVRHRFSGIGFGSWQKNMLALEILMLVGSAFVATGWHDMLMACLFSFATEAQLAVFGKWEGRGHATTICTGNIRNLGQYLLSLIHIFSCKGSDGGGGYCHKSCHEERQDPAWHLGSLFQEFLSSRLIFGIKKRSVSRSPFRLYTLSVGGERLYDMCLHSL